MGHALIDAPSWDEVNALVESDTVRRLSELVGSGTKTIGARRFFKWVAQSSDDDAVWMQHYLKTSSSDVEDRGTIQAIHRVIETWLIQLAEPKIFKNMTLRGHRSELISAIEKLREIEEFAFPHIDARLIPLPHSVDKETHSSLADLKLAELSEIGLYQRDAAGLALIRSAAFAVFEEREKIFEFGQRVMSEACPSDEWASHWSLLRDLIQDEMESWSTRRCSQFKKWTPVLSERLKVFAQPGSWQVLGLDIFRSDQKLHLNLVADLITSCVGPSIHASQAIQVIFCCDTGWNRQPIQSLSAMPFAFRSGGKVTIGSSRVLLAYKNRADHAVSANPDLAKMVRGIAGSDSKALWQNISSELKLGQADEQSELAQDSELIRLLVRYQRLQTHSRSWTDEETSALFFHELRQRAGLAACNHDIGRSMPTKSILTTPGLTFSAIRKSFLNSLSTVGFEPREISEFAGHRNLNILQQNYIVGSQAARVYEEPIRFWQGCVQELILDDRIALALRVPEANREWFRMLAELTGVTSACGMTSDTLETEVSEDFLFEPNADNLLSLYLTHRSLKRQRHDVPHERWLVQGRPLLAMIKGIGRTVFKKSLWREYLLAARRGNDMVETGRITLPILLEI